MYGVQTATRQPSYAPTPYNHVPNMFYNAKVSMDEEMKLADTVAERDLVDSLAEIYSIIKTLDGLEKAYQRDAVTDVEYTDMSVKMLKQYQHLLSDRNVMKEFQDLDSFMREWELECPRAAETLRAGLPRTATYAPQASQQPVPVATPAGPSGALILTATENFITFLDALKLNYVSKSTLHPLLSDVIQSVNKVSDKDFEHRGKIIQWLIKLNQMRTTEELTDEQAKDLAFDMEQAYNGFKSIVS